MCINILVNLSMWPRHYNECYTNCNQFGAVMEIARAVGSRQVAPKGPLPSLALFPRLYDKAGSTGHIDPDSRRYAVCSRPGGVGVNVRAHAAPVDRRLAVLLEVGVGPSELLGAEEAAVCRQW